MTLFPSRPDRPVALDAHPPLRRTVGSSAAGEMRAVLVCGGVLVATSVLSHLLAATEGDRFPWVSAVVFAVIALQGVLIVGLLLQRRWRRQAELEAQAYRAELYHAMRLATLGELTASIAHEVNQPLGAILSNADAAEMMLEAGAPLNGEVGEIIADIRRDAQRASGIIRQTRLMIGKRPTGTSEVDLHQLVRDVRHFVSAALAHQGVTMDLVLDGDRVVVMGDTVQLQQVVLNLVVNAMDATSGITELVRRVEVRTTRVAADRVELTVADNGHGIPDDELPHLFEPFFTTKPQGCGLGLPIARSIVEAHGGSISARNQPSGGAVFRLLLPALPADSEGAPSDPAPALHGSAPRGSADGTKGH